MIDALTPVALAKKEVVLRAVADGRRLGLQLNPALPDIAVRMRRAGGVWCAARRMWVVKGDDPAVAGQWIREQFVDLAALADLDAVPSDIERVCAAPAKDFFAEVLDVQVFPLQQSGHHAVSFIYDVSLVDAMRRLGGRFHKFAKAWEVKVSLAELLAQLNEHAGIGADYVFVHDTAVVLEDLAGATGSPVPITVPGAAPTFTPTASGDGEAQGSGFLSTSGASLRHLDVDEGALAAAAGRAGLHAYQHDGARFLLERTGALLAFDMGLGKTRTSIVAAHVVAAALGGAVVVACPASLRITWEREILAVFPEALIGVAGEDRTQTLARCEWIIVNYERLGTLVREVSIKVAAVLTDEAQMLKEADAGRTRNAFIVAARSQRVYHLSGTPLMSREIELHTLLRMSGHRLGLITLKEFRERYAGASDKRALLSDELRDWMLRRGKDVLDLGRKYHEVKFINPVEGMGTYQALWVDPNLTAMPKLTKLRQCLEMVKFDFIVQTILGLAEDDKIIVFCEYMATVDALRETLREEGIEAVSLVGADPARKRQAAIDAFQQNPRVKVFIGTTSAAGVGITLTAANYVMFASLPWTAATQRQAEDRAYRLGQKRDVCVIVPLVAGTIDEQIHALLASKAELEKDVVEALRIPMAR
jgi:SNF2-related domain